MGRRIWIKASPIKAAAELNDTRTAQAIWDALPIKGHANLWGEEIYFPIPLDLELEAGQEFFGPTAISRGDEIRPASPVTVFGKVIGDATVFKQVASKTEITIERRSNG